MSDEAAVHSCDASAIEWWTGFLLHVLDKWLSVQLHTIWTWTRYRGACHLRFFASLNRSSSYCCSTSARLYCSGRGSVLRDSSPMKIQEPSTVWYTNRRSCPRGRSRSNSLHLLWDLSHMRSQAQRRTPTCCSTRNTSCIVKGSFCIVQLVGRPVSFGRAPQTLPTSSACRHVARVVYRVWSRPWRSREWADRPSG